MKTILITGSKGQVGQEFQILSKSLKDLSFIFVDIEELDITDATAVSEFFEDRNIDYCINCAAYTAVDRAEEDPELARKVNVTGAKNLALACAASKTALLHLSTDYVYHNQQNTPFKEGDPTNPQGVYAKTKLEGDVMAQKFNPDTLIMRTSWVYSSFGHNFVKTMLRLGAERDSLGVVFDQIGTPTYARDIASSILEIIEKIEKGEVEKIKWNGVYHFSNEGITSWYDFSKAIFEIRDIKCKVNPIETSAYPTPASRPPFSALNKGKIKSTFQLEIPHWRESLNDCLELLS